MTSIQFVKDFQLENGQSTKEYYNNLYKLDLTKSERFYPTGEIECIKYYRNGALTKSIKYHLNGQLKCEAEFNGKKCCDLDVPSKMEVYSKSGRIIYTKDENGRKFHQKHKYSPDVQLTMKKFEEIPNESGCVIC